MGWSTRKPLAGATLSPGRYVLIAQVQAHNAVTLESTTYPFTAPDGHHDRFTVSWKTTLKRKGAKGCKA